MTKEEHNRLLQFFYLLMRDYLPSGDVHTIINTSNDQFSTFCNPFLEKDAETCIKAILSGSTWREALRDREKRYSVYLTGKPTDKKITKIKIYRFKDSSCKDDPFFYPLKESKDAVEQNKPLWISLLKQELEAKIERLLIILQDKNIYDIEYKEESGYVEHPIDATFFKIVEE